MKMRITASCCFLGEPTANGRVLGELNDKCIAMAFAVRARECMADGGNESPHPHFMHSSWKRPWHITWSWLERLAFGVFGNQCRVRKL